MIADAETRVSQEVAVEAAKEQAEGLDVTAMTRDELADMLADMGLKKSGNKSALKVRLANALREEG